MCARKAPGPAHPDDREAQPDVDQLDERIDPKALTQRPNRRQAVTPRYAIADGRVTVGVVELTTDGIYIAVASSGAEIGRFRTLREAGRAFDEAAERGRR